MSVSWTFFSSRISKLREMSFVTVGLLPAAAGRWHVREGGGHLWFVNEDPTVSPYVYYNGAMTKVVDASKDAEAPLIMPKVTA